MKRISMLFSALLCLGATRPPNPGQAVFVFQVTDAQLYEAAETSARWKDFFAISGDTAWAAYFAGREAVYREQYAELWGQVGLRPE